MKNKMNFKRIKNKLWKNRNNKQRTFIFCVLMPTILCAIYYILIASDIYVVEAKYAIKGNQSTQLDMLGGLTGLSGQSSTSSDSYILQEYLHSQEAISKIQKKIDLTDIYNHEDTDFLSKLGNNKPAEDLLDYWREKITSSYDPTTGVTTLKVRTFNPEDSVKLAKEILQQNESLINQLSERARSDDLSFAENELSRAEERVKAIRLAMQSFRNKYQDLDPTKTAEAKLSIVSTLEAKLTESQTQLNQISSYMDSSAPAIINLKTTINSIETQLENEKISIAGNNDDFKNIQLSVLFSEYEPLLAERELAEKSYASAIVSLEAARIESIKKHRYLTTFVAPMIPQIALEPNRSKEIITVFLLCFFLWGIGIMVLGSVKDHMGWV
jgi:capsular polysaccharide transport system permease protein